MKKIIIVMVILFSMFFLPTEIGWEYYSDPFSLSDEEIESSRNAVHLPFATPLPIPPSQNY